jgi:hypothetical protein
MALTKVNTDLLADGGKLNGIEAGADVTDTTNVTAAGALMDSELTSIASVKALDQGVATTDSPTFVDVTATSLDISGDIDVDGTTNLDVVDIDGAVDMASTLNVSGAITGTLGTAAQTNITSLGTLTGLSVTGDLLVGDKIRHAGDTDNYIAFPNADEFRIVTGNAGRIYAYNSQVVINEDSTDTDFRVESNGNANMLFVDGGNNRVGVGKSSPSSPLDVADPNASETTITAAFRAGSDNNNNRANIFIGQQDNSRGMLLRAGRESGDRAIAQFILNGSGGTIGSNIINFLECYQSNTGVYETTFNQDGENVDFRVESDNNANMLFVDGGNNAVGIGTNVAGNSTLEVRSTGVDGTYQNAIGFQYSGNSNEANTISTSVSTNAVNSGFKFNCSDGAGSSGKTSVLKITRADMVVNDDSYDYDFRVESNLQSHMLSVDGGNDVVNFNSTQTTSQQGAGHRADGFQRQFQRDTSVFSISQSANSGTGARTRRVTINLHNYSPVKITIMNGGHYYNNGGAFGYRETTFHVAMETTTFRVNVKVDGVNSGTYASSYGVPTIAAASSNPACQIDFTVAAGMTCSTYVKVEGYGANAILGIADV